MVEDQACQGTNWGYYKQPCGPSCQSVRQKLEQARDWMQKLEFVWGDNSGTCEGPATTATASQ